MNGTPGGNVTGVSFLAIALEQKRLELLRELIPKRECDRRSFEPEQFECRAPSVRFTRRFM
jgi:hypothetical protein